MEKIYLSYIIIILIFLITSILLLKFKNKYLNIILCIILLLSIVFGCTFIWGNITFYRQNIDAVNYIKELSNKYLSTNEVKLDNIQRFISNSSYFYPTYNNIEILENGDNVYKSLFSDIASAKNHIHIEDFILEEDKTGMDFIALLTAKSLQGVKVRIIIDAYGMKLKKSTLKSMQKSGIEVCISNPRYKSVLTGMINNRDHRKIFIIDGKTAFMGGINIGDEYLGIDSKIGYWRDTDIRVSGEGVKQLQCIFLASWYINNATKIDDNSLFPPEIDKYKQLSQTVNGYHINDFHSMEQLYLNLINSAVKSIYITTPYLILNEKIYSSIICAKLKGIDIKIIIPPNSDSYIAYKSTNYYANKLVSSGINLYVYNKGFIHSKIIIIDNKVASIGTANLNNRSLNLDYENCMVIYGTDTVNTEVAHFNENLASSSIAKIQTKTKNVFESAVQKIAVFFSPLE